MLSLEDHHYINKGTFQKCYFHPENDDLCVKVKIDESHKDPRVDREIRYYEKIQKKNNNPPITFFARYHGTQETNLGLGYVFDLIRDETTNEVSLTLYDYLKMENSPISDDSIQLELEKLKQQMITKRIIARDTRGQNLCCKILKDNSFELVLIDGIGHRDFIPIVDWVPVFAKRKVNSVFNKKKLNSMNEHRKFLGIPTK